MALCVDGHPVIPFAAGDRIPAGDSIGRRIDDREDVLVLQVDVHFSRDGIVLWHSRLAVKTYYRDRAILPRVDHREGFGPLIGDVGFMEGSGIRDPVRLVLGGNLLHDLHLTKIYDANLVLMPVRRVDLAAFADVGDALDSGDVGD